MRTTSRLMEKFPQIKAYKEGTVMRLVGGVDT